MPVWNADFKFRINVSTGNYPNSKPSKPSTIQYQTQEVTIRDLELLEKAGKSFCYNYKETDESGLITQSQKTIENFDYTNLIFFDIDKMPVSMQEYIDPIPFKPSLSYTTYSNGKEGKYGYRLIYAIDNPIKSVEEFDNIYYAIAAANGFKQRVDSDGKKFEFDYRQVNQQYYGGGVNSESNRTDVVYSISDFSSYIDQGLELKNSISKSSYKSKSNKNDIVINKDIEIKDISCFPIQNNIKKEKKTYYSELEKLFYKDLYDLSPLDFIRKYSKVYMKRYMLSLSTSLTLSEDKKYWIYPEDYKEVRRNWRKNKEGKMSVQKWEIGSDRKKRLYMTAQIMKFNLPDITKEELVFNLLYERCRYYINSDHKITNQIIVETAESALKYKYSLKPIKHPKYSINKDYWNSLGISSNTAKNIIRKELKEKQVLQYYNFDLGIKENLEILKSNGIKVGKSYLYEFKKKYSCFPFQNNIKKEEKTYYSEMENLEDNYWCGHSVFENSDMIFEFA